MESLKTKGVVQRNAGHRGIARGAKNLSSTSTGEGKTGATLQGGTNSCLEVRGQGSLYQLSGTDPRDWVG